MTFSLIVHSSLNTLKNHTSDIIPMGTRRTRLNSGTQLEERPSKRQACGTHVQINTHTEYSVAKIGAMVSRCSASTQPSLRRDTKSSSDQFRITPLDKSHQINRQQKKQLQTIESRRRCSSLEVHIRQRAKLENSKERPNLNRSVQLRQKELLATKPVGTFSSSNNTSSLEPTSTVTIEQRDRDELVRADEKPVDSSKVPTTVPGRNINAVFNPNQNPLNTTMITAQMPRQQAPQLTQMAPQIIPQPLPPHVLGFYHPSSATPLPLLSIAPPSHTILGPLGYPNPYQVPNLSQPLQSITLHGPSATLATTAPLQSPVLIPSSSSKQSVLELNNLVSTELPSTATSKPSEHLASVISPSTRNASSSVKETPIRNASSPSLATSALSSNNISRTLTNSYSEPQEEQSVLTSAWDRCATPGSGVVELGYHLMSYPPGPFLGVGFLAAHAHLPFTFGPHTPNDNSILTGVQGNHRQEIDPAIRQQPIDHQALNSKWRDPNEPPITLQSATVTASEESTVEAKSVGRVSSSPRVSSLPGGQNQVHSSDGVTSRSSSDTYFESQQSCSSPADSPHIFSKSDRLVIDGGAPMPRTASKRKRRTEGRTHQLLIIQFWFIRVKTVFKFSTLSQTLLRSKAHAVPLSASSLSSNTDTNFTTKPKQSRFFVPLLSASESATVPSCHKSEKPNNGMFSEPTVRITTSLNTYENASSDKSTVCASQVTKIKLSSNAAPRVAMPTLPSSVFSAEPPSPFTSEHLSTPPKSFNLATDATSCMVSTIPTASTKEPFSHESHVRTPLIHSYVCRPLRMAKSNEPATYSSSVTSSAEIASEKTMELNDEPFKLQKVVCSEEVIPDVGESSEHCTESYSRTNLPSPMSSTCMWYQNALLIDNGLNDLTHNQHPHTEGSSTYQQHSSNDHNNLYGDHSHFKYPIQSLCSACLRSLLFLPSSKLSSLEYLPIRLSSTSFTSDCSLSPCCSRSRSQRSSLSDPFSRGALLGDHLLNLHDNSDSFRTSSNSPERIKPTTSVLALDNTIKRTTELLLEQEVPSALKWSNTIDIDEDLVPKESIESSSYSSSVMQPLFYPSVSNPFTSPPMLSSTHNRIMGSLADEIGSQTITRISFNRLQPCLQFFSSISEESQKDLQTNNFTPSKKGSSESHSSLHYESEPSGTNLESSETYNSFCPITVSSASSHSSNEDYLSKAIVDLSSSSYSPNSRVASNFDTTPSYASPNSGISTSLTLSLPDMTSKPSSLLPLKVSIPLHQRHGSSLLET